MMATMVVMHCRLRARVAMLLGFMSLPACNGSPIEGSPSTWSTAAVQSMRSLGVPTQFVFDREGRIPVAARVALVEGLRTGQPLVEAGWVDGDERVLTELLLAGMRAWRTTADGVERYVPEHPLPEGEPQPISATIRVAQGGRIEVSTPYTGAYDLVAVTATGCLVTAWDDAGRAKLEALLARGPARAPLWCRLRARDAWRGSDWEKLAR